MYWVTTEGGYRLGPFDDYVKAYESALINLGFEGWTISKA